MTAAPKTAEAIFNMASVLYMNQLRILQEHNAPCSPEVARMAAENSLADATIFMQTFKDKILTRATVAKS